MSADRTYVRAWLRYLFGSALDVPGFVRWSWWDGPGAPKTAGCPVAELDQAAEAMAALSDRGCAVYLRQTLTVRPPANEDERGDVAVTGWVTHLWADLDVAGPRHADHVKPLPPTKEAAESIADEVALMSAVLDSGGGLYGVWMLDEPVDVRDAERRAEVGRLVKRFGHALTAAGDRRGWHVDSVSNLDRILRPAGVLSVKRDHPAGLVTVRRGWVDGAGPYPFGELAAAGIDAVPRKPRREPSERRTNGTVAGDSVLDVANNVWTLKAVLEADTRFGPWTAETDLDAGRWEHWLRAGSSSSYSIKRDLDTGAVIVWSDYVAAQLNMEAGQALSLAEFAARLFGMSLSDLCKEVLRRARRHRQEGAQL